MRDAVRSALIRARAWVPSRADRAFARLLKRDIPILADRRSADLEKAHALREFAFRNINRSPRHPVLQLPDRLGDDFYRLSASALFGDFLSHNGSTMCHGNAYAVTRLCSLFGLDSFVYNMGIPEGSFTHAVAVVTVRHEGQKIAIVEDGHLGMTIEDASGAPVDFFELLRRLQARRHDTLRMRFQPDRVVPYIVPAGHQAEQGEALAAGGRELPGGNVLYRQTVDLDSWCDRRSMPGLMQERGYPPEFLYLYCFPLGVFAAGGSATREARTLSERIRRTLDSGSYHAGAASVAASGDIQ